MITIACVFRSGGPYRLDDVRKLANAVQRHCHQPYRFVCLTDLDWPDVETVEFQALRFEWPGWWSKFELFRPDVFWPNSRVLYFDLDTLILSDLKEIVETTEETKDFIVLRDFYRLGHYGTGVMGFTSGMEVMRLFDRFWRSPEQYVRMNSNFGDQNLIEQWHTGAKFWQDLLPGRIVSYKLHCKLAGVPPPEATVVCFHGQPKAPDVKEEWVKEAWR